MLSQANQDKGMKVNSPTANPIAVKVFNDRRSHYIDQGLSAGEAAEMADMDLLQWSNPPVDNNIFRGRPDEIEQEWMGFSFDD